MLFSIVAVAVPSLCVLWFMNEAVNSQADAARVALLEAHRGQLRLIRTKLNQYWQDRAAALDANLPRAAPAAFEYLVKTLTVDSAIILGPNGLPLYPAVNPPLSVTSDVASSTAAIAAQEAVRELIQSGATTAAIDAIVRHFVTGPSARGHDRDGRLIAADEQLLLIRLLPRADRRRASAIARLTTLLNAYAGSSIPSAQRVFLIEQLRSAVPDAEGRFPMLAAERLALFFLEREQPSRTRASLHQSAGAEVWQLTSAAGRVAALYHTESLRQAMQRIVEEQSSSTVRFAVMPSGQSADVEALEIGPIVPGWEVSFAMPNGGEVWQGREPARVRWQDNLGPSDEIAIALSKNGGRTYHWAIAPRTFADGVHVATVVPAWSTARAQLRIVWLAHPAVGDVSDGSFVIRPQEPR